MNVKDTLLRQNRENLLTDRIFSEIEFAKRISAKLDGKFDEIIKSAENYIGETTSETKILTDEMVKKAEDILSPVSKEAKEYKIICTAHAHIDMNWQWGWDETVSLAVDTVTTMLKLLKEYPDYHFSLSQVSTYKIIKDYAPELFEEIKKYVKEGRWEATAPTWVENDRNMPNELSLTNQFVYAKKWLAENLEVDPYDISLDFEPDTFGHSANLPDILNSVGVKYFYFCRGETFKPSAFVWRSASGKEVIANRETNFYSSQVTTLWAQVAFEMSELNKIKTTLRAYGVGDHGGGPSRRDIEFLHEMNSWPCFPEFKLGTYKEYFEILEKHKELLPVYTGEINLICDGCYTSESRIKQKNKETEHKLYSAAAIGTQNLVLGLKYKVPAESSYQRFLVGHFHDIVTGSGVPATKDFMLGEFQNILADVENTTKFSASQIAENINTKPLFDGKDKASDTAMGSGVGSGQYERGSGLRRVLHIFNTELKAKSCVQEIKLWDWNGDRDRLYVTDANGNKLEHQVMGYGKSHYWGHNYTDILVYVTLPAGGFTTIICDEEENVFPKAVYWTEKRKQKPEEFVLENDLIKAEFSRTNCSIKKVTDKITGKVYLESGESNFKLYTEANRKDISYHYGSEMSAWLVGRTKNIEDIQKSPEMTYSYGPIHNEVTAEFSFGRFNQSKIKFIASLDKGSRLIKYRTVVDFLETGSQEFGVPTLVFTVPLNDAEEKFTYDIPYGTIDREATKLDTVGLSYAKNGSISIHTKDTFGYKTNKDSLSLTVLRGSYDPDPYPEYGRHTMNFAVGFDYDENSSTELAYMENTTVVTGYAHDGKLAPDMSVIENLSDSIKVYDFAVNEKTATLRLYNPKAECETVKIKFNGEVQSACLTDALGKYLADTLIIDNCVSFTAENNSTYTLKVSF